MWGDWVLKQDWVLPGDVGLRFRRLRKKRRKNKRERSNANTDEEGKVTCCPKNSRKAE